MALKVYMTAFYSPVLAAIVETRKVSLIRAKT
jgi:hypothetical protein